MLTSALNRPSRGLVVIETIEMLTPVSLQYGGNGTSVCQLWTSVARSARRTSTTRNLHRRLPHSRQSTIFYAVDRRLGSWSISADVPGGT